MKIENDLGLEVKNEPWAFSESIKEIWDFGG
jgi:hypothetical protein